MAQCVRQFVVVLETACAFAESECCRCTQCAQCIQTADTGGLGAAPGIGMQGFAFGALRLHRVEAACVPTNHASRRVLEKSGFRHEGLAKAYLKINDDWADHLLFGVVSDDWVRDV